MKKFIVILIVFFLAFSDCKKIEPESEPEFPVYQPKEVQEFLNSEDFKKNECLFENYGQIGIGKVQRLQISGDSAYQLIIPTVLNSDTTAYLQVIKLPEGNLPDGGVYFMNLIDLTRGFDNSKLTGNVVMLGINYDAFQHCELTIKKNVIVFSEFFPLPEKYLEEMAAKCKLRDFLSCYRNIKDEMDADDMFYFLCDIVGPACAVSAAAYCIMQ